jgi:hypothetical protein
MGTLGVGIMNSMAFSLLANSNLKVDENQENGADDQKFELLHQTFGFNPPFGSDEIGSVGKQS